MSKLAGAFFAVTALAATAANASSIRCWGQLRLADCRPVTVEDYEWPSSSQPSFTAQCEGSSSPNDAGYTWMPWPPQTGEFVLTVAGLTYRNSTPPGAAQTIYFENTGKSCEGQPLFRYTGPLQPGMKHVIDLGGHDYPKAPISFYVGQAPGNDPTPTIDPSSHPDASAGCSCSLVGRAGFSGSPMGPFILALVGVGLRGRRRRRD